MDQEQDRTYDRDRAHDRRIAELLARMTDAEKLGQLQQLAWTGDTGPGGGQNHLIETAAREGALGSVLNLHGAAHTNTLQRIAVEESRLGIPLLFGFDVIHGFWTTFPIPLAQAASFDPAVAERDGEVAAGETRSNGVHWTFAPMMDVTRDPRWGRIAESCGEDPYLTAAFAAAKVRGHQGEDLRDSRRIAACAKHFAAYGGAEGGRDYNTVDVSEQRLRNLYLPPFKAAVEAGAATVMAAFNTVSGVPAHAHPHLLSDILKEEWGFDGVVVSDWNGVHELITHGFAEDAGAAAGLAFEAGLDMEMVSTDLADHGRELLRAGALSAVRLDDAVARVLRLKFRLGLFERPYVDEGAALTGPTAESRAAARETAGRCVVLLKNEGDTLPLSRALSSVAVVGPFADSTDLHGTWSGPGASRFPAVTVLDGIRAALPDAAVVRHAEDHDAAVAAALSADLTVVVAGEPTELSGEAASRSDLSLPAGQEELIRAIAATGRPFVVVLVGGRPLTVDGWIDRAPAVLAAWHLGIEAGNALADVLFGEVNPGAKVPVSFPRSVGQIPVYHNHENTGRPSEPDGPGAPFTSSYLDTGRGPRFPFGFGLSYTDFEIGEPELSRDAVGVAELSRGAEVEVAVAVRNTGQRAGDEVVQLYTHDRAASVVQPVRRLRGFRRVTLGAGESAVVRFRLGAEDLGFWTNDPAGRFLVEPGRIDLYTGNSSRATARRTLTLTP
ncbi:glycoside hydrolase family 3 C-terminal domain-containing protein [Streptomyces scopuliridis]|uniref:Glycoside hydrolase family 3 C-terminal domain-containing protein n=1 Tax=Streptomyces scopuliridis TaxID=452529 RepID=A0ACD4ZFP6_9ACTN|nr:glycoside hydrolase family 3 N-terminal domain-containing protein [Streptomyces scopuliridis]WSB32942.1 glycoside hydrolase family 3 C-terminal domain-containing protein [Streptomyces scopuliridis]WSB97199.1 glycoside hydrolase family 3 C-terminal domain-containing protein [Streptomyces scopuliridis]WSC09097.1 glycoside hydrolase family 3 C-terminal domain-containing protein [Streptomyces scopuliridis]